MVARKVGDDYDDSRDVENVRVEDIEFRSIILALDNVKPKSKSDKLLSLDYS